MRKALIIGIVIAVGAVAIWGATRPRVVNVGKNPVIVELFTSQG